MPAESENQEDSPLANDFVDRFEQFLDDQVTTDEGLQVDMIDNMEVVLYCRLRSLFTPAQLHGRAHAIIMQGEQILQTPGMLIDAETGEAIQPILVENFQGDREEYQAMLSRSTQELTDDEITAFFGGEGEEE